MVWVDLVSEVGVGYLSEHNFLWEHARRANGASRKTPLVAFGGTTVLLDR